MPQKNWTLADVDADVYVDRISIGPAEVGGAAGGYSVVKQTLRGGLREGVDAVEVDNGRLRFTVVPTRGMGIHRAICGDVTLGWQSPVRGPVHPAFVHTWEPSGIGFLDGFDELLVRCGLESNGAPEFAPNGSLLRPLHGRIANMPAHKVEVAIDGDSGWIEVRGVVDEARLFGNKMRLTTVIRTQVGTSELSITDEVTNLSAEPGELELLYHVNFGMPLVSPGARVLLPIKTLAPQNAIATANLPTWNVCGPESPGTPEACFFFELLADASGWTRAMLQSADGDRGVSVKFDHGRLPYFIVWKNRQAAADGYVVGLEPALNFPNRKSFEKAHGRVVVLAPGESRRFELAIEAHADAASVTAAARAVAALQNLAVPDIRPRPNPDWSPAP